MKITAQDLLKFGIIDAVVPEPIGGAHRDPEATVAATGKAIGAALYCSATCLARSCAKRARRSSWRWGAGFEDGGVTPRHCEEKRRSHPGAKGSVCWPRDCIASLRKNKRGGVLIGLGFRGRLGDVRQGDRPSRCGNWHRPVAKPKAEMGKIDACQQT